MKMMKARITKLTAMVMKLPYASTGTPAFFRSASVFATPGGAVPSTTKRFEKSSLPNTSPTIGMMMSATSESTILPNAAPMITPTARSITLPLTANSLNSLRMLMIQMAA